MGRREFIAALGGPAAWPLTARAQQPALPVVGFFNGYVGDAAPSHVAALRNGLGDPRYVGRQNLTVEYHWPGANTIARRY